MIRDEAFTSPNDHIINNLNQSNSMEFKHRNHIQTKVSVHRKLNAHCIAIILSGIIIWRATKKYHNVSAGNVIYRQAVKTRRVKKRTHTVKMEATWLAGADKIWETRSNTFKIWLLTLKSQVSMNSKNFSLHSYFCAKYFYVPKKKMHMKKKHKKKINLELF